ncbi:branched-chain amino acid aminotransferase [Staphylococcus aureus]|nr:branched-chain amino acid aminotransferase [Staphylococcus aureus]
MRAVRGGVGHAKVAGNYAASLLAQPVGQLKYGETEIVINNNETGEVTQNLYDNYTGIQSGKLEDPQGWRVVVPRY